LCCSYFFTDSATTELYTLSLHDALPIFLTTADTAWLSGSADNQPVIIPLEVAQTGLALLVYAAVGAPLDSIVAYERRTEDQLARDRKSTRLNSSHVAISYAVFCLKKKKT